MNKDKLRQTINVFAILITLAVNGLANALPLNGHTTGEISDMFTVYFIPAGYVFSIWGIIYLFLIGFAIYQALPSQREDPRLRSIGYIFALSCLANSTWIFLWHYLLFPWTLLVMTALLGLLIAIYLRLGIGQARVAPAEAWLVDVPFSIYLGWISVAAISNATVLLAYLGWNGWGIPTSVWAIIMLAAATLIASLVSLRRGDVAYALVIVWAFAGIAIQQSATPAVSIAAWVASGLAALMLVVGLFFYELRRQSGKG